MLRATVAAKIIGGMALGAALALSSCGRGTPAGEADDGARPTSAAATADPALCGREPLPSIEAQGVANVPRGLSRPDTEDAVSKALGEDSSNCMRSASFLFASAPEPVDVVVNAVLAQCNSANQSYRQHCNALTWETATSEFPFKGETFEMRLYCGASKETEAEANTRLRSIAYANVVKARAGRCWLLPRAK